MRSEKHLAKAPSGAIVLFDGTNLDHWQHANGKKPAGFAVHDGIMTVRRGGGSIITRRTFGDFQMHVEFRTPNMPDQKGQARGNSGVYIQRRYEVQILATADQWRRTGCIYSMTRAPADVQRPPGEWNTMDITMDGLRTTVTLNDTLVTTLDPSQPLPPPQFDYDPKRGPRPEYGYIGLQNHDGDSIVAFREVSVSPLP